MADGGGAPLRVLLSVHHDLAPGAGAPGSTLALRDELRGRGHHVDAVGFELLGRRRGPTADAVAFPWVLARHVRARLARGDLDVVDASTGDLSRLRRDEVEGAATAFLTRSHGLEPLGVARRRRGAADGELRLRWRYGLYHGGMRVREVERSLRVADAVLVLNEAERTYVTTSLGVATDRVVATAPVVAPLEVPAGRHGAPSRDVLVLGPASWRKGGDVAARVLEGVLRASPTASASWHGLDDPSALGLATDVAARVVVGGRYGRDELGALLGAHRVLLFASRFEGLPVTVLEALSTGVPVVGADVPGVSDLLGDGVGVLVPDGHVEGFVGAVRRLLADDSARAAHGRAGRERAATLAPPLVVGALEGAYRHVLERKPRR